MTTTTIPTSTNETYGFYGTMGEQAEAAWPMALTAIAMATDASQEGVRAFLDSRHGRHFADDVQNQRLQGLDLEPAIHAAIERWMGWTIGRQTSREYDIPRGLPYLTGFVVHCEIADALS